MHGECVCGLGRNDHAGMPVQHGSHVARNAVRGFAGDLVGHQTDAGWLTGLLHYLCHGLRVFECAEGARYDWRDIEIVIQMRQVEDAVDYVRRRAVQQNADSSASRFLPGRSLRPSGGPGRHRTAWCAGAIASRNDTHAIYLFARRPPRGQRSGNQAAPQVKTCQLGRRTEISCRE